MTCLYVDSPENCYSFNSVICYTEFAQCRGTQEITGLTKHNLDANSLWVIPAIPAISVNCQYIHIYCIYTLVFVYIYCTRCIHVSVFCTFIYLLMLQCVICKFSWMYMTWSKIQKFSVFEFCSVLFEILHTSSYLEVLSSKI